MNYTVINRGLSVGNITVTAVASSSVLLVGDTESIACSSIFDTPPESLIITRPFVPIAS
ncbi:spore gernimation protein GerPD [Guptibacillus hwajinpoensis]|uniref:Spore germination protein PD n=1 Tax=Guptibacillus hwajinpoensis TaxID=208199 RepID=A0ABU0K2L8_9BACL|nr:MULTISPECIES: spore gernimation protein GerPD [Alkalihalobacillus]MDP4550690.1 spore gernimation protein GerPD [Alkalihalobacillus macyae]MDQ0483524.1 spore germination protein PD [Alkalihalobacillus hemicentroti]